MIKPCSIIYLPGSGGNFIKLCLSLSKETVPYYNFDLNNLTDQEAFEIRSLTADQRLNFLQINSLENFHRFHRQTTQPIFAPDFYYSNTLINNFFEWTIVANHPDNYHVRLPYLKKIIYIDLAMETYQTWTKNAKLYFEKFGYWNNFSCEFDKQMAEVETLKKLSQCLIMDMNVILRSEQGFQEQYLATCKDLDITPELDHALILYRGWRRFRVDPFIH